MVFQILALDGGGAKALFTANILARLERRVSINVVSNFDLVVGTSAGGIISCALGAGLTPADIVEQYAGLSSAVFNARRRVTRVARGMLSPMYSSQPLRSALEAVLGQNLMRDSTRMLAIPAWDAKAGRAQVFKTPHDARVLSDGNLSMVDVAMATSAAPAFFGSVKVDSQWMLDGGVWANNPSMVGVAEAVGVLGVPLEEIRCLNIGTTEPLLPHPRRLSEGGWLAWAPHATGLVLRASSKGGQGIAQHLLGERYQRVDALVHEKAFRLDKVSRDEMDSVAAQVARGLAPRYVTHFAGHDAAARGPWLAA